MKALAAILRLALALDRTHQQHVADVRARVRDDVVRIVIQSQGDAEVDVWAAERKVDLFEKVFGRKVRFPSARPTLDKCSEFAQMADTVTDEFARSSLRKTHPKRE